MHPLCLRSDIRDSSASSVKHPMFPLCVCFEIAPDNPLLSAFNREASDNPFYILSLFVLFSFCFLNFRQFCRFLEWMKTEAAKPESFVVHCVLFAYTFCSSVSETGLYTKISCLLLYLRLKIYRISDAHANLSPRYHLCLNCSFVSLM